MKTSQMNTLVIPQVTNDGNPIRELSREYLSSLVGFDKAERIVILDGVTDIGWDAFKDCKNLISIFIPNSVTGIGCWAFAGCDNLKDVVMSESVTHIGERAFEDCKSLVSIFIPRSVVYIGLFAFLGCENLKRVVIPETHNLDPYVFYLNPNVFPESCRVVKESVVIKRTSLNIDNVD